MEGGEGEEGGGREEGGGWCKREAKVSESNVLVFIASFPVFCSLFNIIQEKQRKTGKAWKHLSWMCVCGGVHLQIHAVNDLTGEVEYC